jgi:DNA repair photolyase
MKVIPLERRSSVLAPSSLGCLAHIPAINLTSGCAHSCIYCYAHGYSTYPGQGAIVVYKNILEKLKKELSRKRNLPKVIYFSPSSDIFQPIPEVLEIGYSILEYLFSKSVGIAFLTKGYIPDITMDLLLSNADKVRAQIGIITPDDDIRCIFEPNAANINTRLQQMKKMLAGGIAVEARLMPILPGITDSTDSLDCLFNAIADTGVRQATISTLFIRPAIIKALRMHMSDKHSAHGLLNLYENSARIAVHAERSSVIPLPRPMREEIYTRVTQAAKKYVINISVCGCMNPDIGGTCNIGGNWPECSGKAVQPNLFELEVSLH